MKIKKVTKENNKFTVDIEIADSHTYQLANGCISHNTSSLILGSASGIHPHHARKYFRRIQCNKHEAVYQHFKENNPHTCEPSIWSANKTDDVVTFPITVSDKAIIKSDLSAIKHLEIIKSTQQNWVIPGTNTEVNKKPLYHNISATVLIKDDEWNDVINYLYENREFFTAVSLLPAIGDKLYKQAPLEAVSTPEDEEKWKQIVTNYKSVNYKELKEDEDETELMAAAACAGGACEVI
jgi:ribonucleoside-diphosphate reductase alpha chain